MTKSKNGFALITVLALAIMLGLGIAALLHMVATSAQLNAISAKGTQAQYILEAAIQDARFKCKLNGGVCTSGNTTIDGWNVQYNSTFNAGLGVYQIDATVNYPDA